MAPVRTLAGTLVLCLAPALAFAQITPIPNPQGFSQSAALVTFQGQGSSGPTVSSLGGVTFAQGSTAYLALGSDDDSRPFGPPDMIAADNRGNQQPISLGFASPINRVGFVLRFNGCGGRATVEFRRGQTSLGSTTTSASQPGTSYGSNPCAPAAWLFAAYQTSEPFDRVVISAPGGYARIDNIRFENALPPAPVVSTLADPSAFTSAATLLTFQGLGVTGPPRVATLNGATFSVGSQAYVSLGNDDRARPFGPPDPLVVDNQPGASQPITIAFASPVTRVAFEAAYNGCAQSVAVAFFSGNTQVGSARTPASGTMPGNNCSPGNFVFAGFQMNVPFDRIRLTAPVGGYLRLDNLRFER